ncbi:putative F-box/LRR-repeat protein 23 [Trifolium pratense]|uniref:putative F-box/LRR-repeat protein 23 n=1 Tax=Trifolium pratense TaxID=57577 RepID=UPI001E69242A|nr:putative F-box/LRR-repeat protein 23 [Trifolium pratense]
MASCSLSSMKAEAENTTVPNWLELPRDITTNILQRLDTIEIVTIACHVCPLWWNICKDPLMWRTIRMTNLHHLQHKHLELVKICCYAIERSCGHLEDIDIQFFGSNDVLECIAINANNLRCMRLVYCRRISDEGLSLAVRNLPLLEEVDISFNMLNEDSLEALGRCCPRLKSLTFARMLCEHFGYGSENIGAFAFAIAKTMPRLLHLKISGNVLSNDGVLAILDGCPLLESLDLTRCLYVHLSDSLEKRGREQIKDFGVPILPDYSSSDDDYYYCESLEKRCREQIKDFRLPIQDCYSSDSDWDICSENSNWSGYED